MNELDSNDAGEYLVFGHAVSVNDRQVVVGVHRGVCPPRERPGLVDWLHKQAIAAIIKHDDGAVPHPAPWPDRRRVPWVRRIWHETTRTVVINPVPEADELETSGMTRERMMRVRLAGPQQRQLETLSAQHGLEPIELLSRLVEWFGSAEEWQRREIESRFADVARRRNIDLN